MLIHEEPVSYPLIAFKDSKLFDGILDKICMADNMFRITEGFPFGVGYISDIFDNVGYKTKQKWTFKIGRVIFHCSSVHMYTNFLC